MLFKNGIDLFNQLQGFLNKSSNLFIYVPYIKIDILKLLIDNRINIKSITVRWEALDILTGASDLDIYPYLKEKGIPLFRNSRLHLKAFVDNYERAFVGSANISQRALNFPKTANYNYELGVVDENLLFADRLYFSMIEAESALITDEIYNQLKHQLAHIKVDFPKESDFSFEVLHQNRSFLISSLPMSYDVETLIKIYENSKSDNEVDLNCALHDLAIYNIPPGLDRIQFRHRLKAAFFNHPFIRAFLENLDIKGEIYFGRAKDWIQKNCTDVPIPRKWEVTTNIQILYRWIVYLSDGVYDSDKPSYSERLFATRVT